MGCHAGARSISPSLIATAWPGAASCGRRTASSQTPVFMPVGTRGAVKAVTHRAARGARRARSSSATPITCILRPGDDLIARAGGLHRFIGWDRPILTDSGGYQVFSLATMRRIREEGAEFRSHLDGALHALTPGAGDRHPGAARLRHRHGARRVHRDAGHAARRPARRWSGRSAGRGAPATASFGSQADPSLVSGDQPGPGAVRHRAGRRPSPTSALRAWPATIAIGFEAYAIGGLSVGEPPDVMYEVVAHTAPLLPDDRPRYLMGTGMPDDLFECVARGIDMFDCVLPTRNARNGQLLTTPGPARRSRTPGSPRTWRRPIRAAAATPAGHFSRAYLRHLYMSRAR